MSSFSVQGPLTSGWDPFGSKSDLSPLSLSLLRTVVMSMLVLVLVMILNVVESASRSRWRMEKMVVSVIHETRGYVGRCVVSVSVSISALEGRNDD